MAIAPATNSMIQGALFAGERSFGGGGSPDVYVSPRSAAQYAEWMARLKGTAAKTNTSVLAILKAIRNRIVGHAGLKRHFVRDLDLLDCLLPHLQPQDRPGCKEGVIIIGSIAYDGGEGLTALLSRGVPHILLLLTKTTYEKRDDPALLEATLRALRNIYRHDAAPKDLPFDAEFIQTLALILADNEIAAVNGKPREYVSVLLASCCDSGEKQKILAGLGFMEFAAEMVLNSRGAPFTRLEAALDLLAALTRDNPDTSRQLSRHDSLVEFIFELLRRRSTPEIRIFSALCLTNFVRASLKATDLAPTEFSSKDPRIQRVLLPNLVGLLERDSSVRARTAEILTLLISDSEALQVAVCDGGVISRLCDMLTRPRDERETETALIAFAAISSFKEDCRRSVIEAKIFPQILAAMESTSERVRSAACQCARSLSRSVKNLRTCLVDVGLVTPLLKLLRDPSLAVKRTACATLCNLVLDFSPMKETVLKEGGVQCLVQLTSSNDQELKCNALWALKNLLYLADTSIKLATMDLLTFARLEELAQDPCGAVQEQTLNLIRNLVCEKEQDISEVAARCGETRLIKLVEGKMNSDNEEIVMHACYIVANACTVASAGSKDAVMKSSVVLDKLAALLRPGVSVKLQLAALWCIINLTWTDDSGSVDRIAKLRSRGIEKLLIGLAQNISLVPDVKDRLQTALDNFSALDPPSLTVLTSSRSRPSRPSQ